MTRRDQIRDELGAHTEDEIVQLAERLEGERPVPSAAFRGQLRRALLAGGNASARPRRLRLLVAAYAGSGLFLLAVAAVGLAGAGPFAG